MYDVGYSVVCDNQLNVLSKIIEMKFMVIHKMLKIIKHDLISSIYQAIN